MTLALKRDTFAYTETLTLRQLVERYGVEELRRIARLTRRRAFAMYTGTWSVVARTRKPHRCARCGREIPKGSPAVRYSEWTGEGWCWETRYYCADCWRLRIRHRVAEPPEWLADLADAVREADGR